VTMNYRAACRAGSHDEFVAKMCVTVEEADEAQGWLDSLIKKASGAEAERLFEKSTELLKIFSASKRTAMRNQSQRRSPKRKVTKPKNR
jgi:four helix bundle protein